MLSYNVSAKTIRDKMDCAAVPYDYKTIFEICDDLSSRAGIDTNTLEKVASFLNDRPGREADMYVKLLSMTLRLGVTAKTVNQVIPDLIPEWEVQQAYPIEKYPLKLGEYFVLTQKLNGVRATYYKGKLYARSGAPFSGLDHIINEIESVSPGGLVFDGELVLLNKGELSDNEAFRKATGIINSDAEQKLEICYTVFDVLDEHEFEIDACTQDYFERRDVLDGFSEQFLHFVSVLPALYVGKDMSMVRKLLDKMVSEDKEGLIVNRDVPYKRKRHNGILKVKKFYTVDLRIVGFEEGSGRLDGTLGAIIADYKGTEVGVGSGFSDIQRDTIWKTRDDLLGKLVEVKYKEVSYDKQTGKYSLQFPTFVTIRHDKDEENLDE